MDAFLLLTGSLMGDPQYDGQIGQDFNDLSYSAVSKVYQRMDKAFEQNKTMRRDEKNDYLNFVPVQGLTPSLQME